MQKLALPGGIANNSTVRLEAGDYVEAPGYLDWGYLEKMCKGTIGYFATQLQPVDVTPQFLSFQPTNGGVLINASGLISMQGLVGYRLADTKALATLGATTYVVGSALAAMPASL